MWKRQKYLAVALVGIVVSLANGAPVLRINGLDATVPLKVEGKGELIISVMAAEVNEQGCSVICEDRGRLEPVSGPNEVNDGNATAYRFVFDDDWELGTVNLIADQNMVIDATAITAGAEIYKLHLCYSLQADTTTAIGIDFEGLSWVAPEPEQQETSGLAVSGGEAQLPLVGESPALPAAGRRKKALLNCPGTVEGLGEAVLSRSSYKGFSPTVKTPLADRMAANTAGGVVVGMDSVIDVNSDITSNQIWTADNTYHIVTDVNVQALLVIEPGTIVEFAADKRMAVNNGGTLISVGRPDEPVVYTSDSVTPGYGDYYCPLYVEETASPNTKIAYSYVEYAYIGITVLNNHLEADIESNWLYNNGYGIVEFGTEHTDIRNNLVFASCYSGIEVFMESLAGYADANSSIVIQNNTCDYYQDVGILVHGVADANDAGSIVLVNNIVSGSWICGLALVDGYCYATITNTGYYGNAADKNWAFDEYYPVFESALPYEAGTGWMSVCYLRQDCNFIDAGYEYIEETALIGKTTDVSGLPDSNYTDLGFHYFHWDYNNVGEGDYYPGDLDENLIIDFRDFAILANGWQTTYDMNDLATVSENWLRTGGPNPDLQPVFEQDPNNISGCAHIMIDRSDEIIGRVFLFVDGQMRSVSCTPVDTPMVVNTAYDLNGLHSFKVVGIDEAGNVICANTTEANFNNELFGVTVRRGYEIGKDYYFYAFGSPSANYTVEVNDTYNDTIVYSESFTGQIAAAIDSSVFASDHLAYILTAKDSSNPDPPTLEEIIEKEFDPADYPPGANIHMVISIGSEDLVAPKRSVWTSVIREALRDGIKVVFLNYDDCSFENLNYCLHIDKVKMWYHLSHADDKLWYQRQRQCIEVQGGWVYSHLRKDYDPNDVPEDYENLLWGHETKCHSIRELGFANTSKFIWVQFNGCESAATTEFAEHIGILRGGPPTGEAIFIGWKNTVTTNDTHTHYNKWERNLWQFLGLGYDLGTAMDFAGDGVKGRTTIEENFTYYGVADAQFVYFNYPDITTSH